MAIKKAFVAINEVLKANEDKKVKTILPELIELMSTKSAGGGASSVHRNDAGDVVGILDYYYKVWLPVEFVEFGAKANSASGLNTMCKLGNSLWTKQQREFKKGRDHLLDEVAAGNVQPGDIQAHLDQLEEERGFVAEYPIPELAFATIEELDAALEDPQALQDAIDAYEEEQERLAAEAAEAAEAE